MTTIHHESERQTQDLALLVAKDRIADLHDIAASARRAHPATDRGYVDRFRDAIGRRLIGLGNTLVVDDGIRRRAFRP